MVKKINALTARQNFGRMIEEVFYQGDQFVIERAGKPMAAVVPLWQLEAWQQRRAQFFAAVEEVHRQHQQVKPEVIEDEVREAVRAVRTKARRRKV